MKVIQEGFFLWVCKVKVQGKDWMRMIFSLMQNRCSTASRFSPQRDTWRSMASRKSSFTPLVMPRVTVWCLKKAEVRQS